MFYVCYLYLFTHNGVQHYFYFRCHLAVTQHVPHVEQELLTLPEHMRSPRFLMGFVLLDL